MFYSGGSEAGLAIAPSLQTRLKDSIGACVICTQEPAPPGIEQRHSLAAWANKRLGLAEMSDEEDARRWAALNVPLTECAACMSQLHAVIGIPTNVLVPLVERFRKEKRADLIGFLQTRLVFVICKGCASRAYEQEAVSVADIQERYNRMQVALSGTTRKPPELAVRQYNELMEEVRVAIRRHRSVA